MTPEFVKGEIRDKFGTDTYRGVATPNWAARSFPSLYFYWRLAAGPVQWIFRKGARGECDDSAWVHASALVGDLLEQTGCPLEVEGLENLAKANGPCVIAANHMSTLETFVLPAIIRPRMPVTFVVKESLVKMPFFGKVMRSREPVVVRRQSPREDLAAVLGEGCERLARGVSIVIFPQSTRTLRLDRQHFNSAGVKLARKANVPVIPLALKTDAWGQGEKIKELGRIRGGMPVRFKFGDPLTISGTGKNEQEAIFNFIDSSLKKWIETDGINCP